MFMKIFNNKPRGYKHEMSRENHSMFSDERILIHKNLKN